MQKRPFIISVTSPEMDLLTRKSFGNLVFMVIMTVIQAYP